MLIRSLKLINFKKYETLFIDDLPEKGVVKVGGKNEAGKTSIGEAVCFALFGRTFLNSKKNAKRLIRWNEKEMTVSLVLFDDNNEAYKIIRTVNASGLSSIRIMRLSDSHTLTELLEGSDKIISDLLGYNYETFVDSFCMVQREFTAPEVDSN
ncbi:MAG: AAA family ATPase, partial [Cocleimonas sp.]|nr:AAA family ATPase [Cocleimonas sp.]